MSSWTFQRRSSGDDQPYGYTPAQIRHAYGFDKITGNSSSLTLAIIDAYGTITLANDLKVPCLHLQL